MPKAPPPYSAEYREEAFRLAQSCAKRTGEITANLSMYCETLRKGLEEDQVDGGIAPG